MQLDKNFFKSVVPQALFEGVAEPVFGRFVIDSRLAQPGSTFVALPGVSVDGHDFLRDALERGASVLIINKEKRAALNSVPAALLAKASIILVPDSQDALIKLASAWRATFTQPVVGVTGSIGKTSTKEMIATMVRAAGKKCLVSEGNYNTLLGIALTFLQVRPDHECVIVEMGISRRGEMEQLAALARPTIGLITQIAHQHMDGLGSIIDIAAEKRMIFKYFKPDNIGIVNGDQTLLAGVSYSHPTVKFGYKTTNQIQARRVAVSSTKTTATIKIYNDKYAVTLPTPHKGRLCNALASATAAYFLQVPNNIIIDVIQSFESVPGRFQPLALKSGRGIIINDAYNANPESMKEALLAFERLEVHGRKVAVLGDMLGLGAGSIFWHRQVGRLLRKAPSVEQVVFVGDQIIAAQKTLPRSVQAISVPNWEEAVKTVERLNSDQELALLVKGSLDMELQKLVKQLV